MKTTPWLRIFALVLITANACAQDSDRWRNAAPGWSYEWPRDHGPHSDFKTEWWYFTGNLKAADTRRFGYQLTFFRQGVRPPNAPAVKSRFIVPDLKFGHFTITDVLPNRFLFSQRLTRGAFGEAGFGDGARLAWLEDWALTLEPDGSFRIKGADHDRSLELHLIPQKPWVVHGKEGLSIKSLREGHASHYYSGTRLRTSGQIRVGDSSFAVDGESWFDHEWATSQLAPDQAGWDWFSLQLDDGSELMLYRLRGKDGSIDPASSGTFIEAGGATGHLEATDMRLTATKQFHSSHSGADYPIAWRIEIPSLHLDATISTPVQNQELVLQPVTYWEGMVDVVGTRAGKALRGHGYVELTGYAGPIVGLSQPGR
jgi:predicted secreted hydrolase